MNVFIAGGGRVGYHLARLLSAEGHDVTVLETDANQLEHIDYALDVRTMAGNATDVLTLKSANAGNADLFLGATGDDEVNLIAATIAKGLGARQSVARVHNTIYTQSDILYETIMGVDYILSPEALTAHEIVTYIETPGMVAAESFGRGLVQMRQLRVAKSPLGPGQTLKDLQLPQGVLIGVISRNGAIEIPHGGSTLAEHDLVTLIGHREGMNEIQRLFQGVEVAHNKIVIMGGTQIGLQMAQVLEKHGRSVKLFDWDSARCAYLASQLTKTKVVCRDATSRLALEQEHVNSADIFVAVTRDDERNIMASVLAKEVGARETLVVVHQPDFAPLVGKLGIDHAVTPRVSFANRILKLVNKERVSSLAIIEEGQVEILELKVNAESNLLGKSLLDIRFPSHCLVAAILRGDHVIVPRGDDEIHAGDAIIVITNAKSLESVKKMFAP